MTNTVRVKIDVYSASGRRRGWAKHVKDVDQEKTNGYALIGDFLDGGKEYDLPVGAVVVRCDPEGSVKHGWKAGVCSVLQADGTLKQIHEETFNWHKDFLSFRDLVARTLHAQLGDEQREADTLVGLEATIDEAVRELGAARINQFLLDQMHKISDTKEGMSE